MLMSLKVLLDDTRSITSIVSSLPTTQVPMFKLEMLKCYSRQIKCSKFLKQLIGSKNPI